MTTEARPAKGVDGFAPSPPDKTYRHSLVRRSWECQLRDDVPSDIKRLMAECATEIESNLPATPEFEAAMRKGHAKVLR